MVALGIALGLTYGLPYKSARSCYTTDLENANRKYATKTPYDYARSQEEPEEEVIPGNNSAYTILTISLVV